MANERVVENEEQWLGIMMDMMDRSIIEEMKIEVDISKWLKANKEDLRRLESLEEELAALDINSSREVNEEDMIKEFMSEINWEDLD